MSLILFALFGLIAGGIAKAIIPARWPAGWLPTAVLGCAGSIVGGLPFGQGAAGLVGSIVGACVVLYLYSQMQEPAQ